MQATTGTRHGFGIGRLKNTLIAAGLLVTAFAGVATWQLSQDATTAATTPATMLQQVSAAKETRQDTLELEAATLAARAAQQETLQQFSAHKEASMDAEFSAITAQPTLTQRVAVDKATWLDARKQRHAEFAVRQETMRRYYTHKEAQIDALP